MLVWQRPNLLLMDEPTNHLDLSTREALSMALNEYEGTVMLVSHDRALLREVCDEFWLVAGGKVEPFDGDLDEYQQWLLEQSRDAARAAKAARREEPAAVVAAAPPPKPAARARRNDKPMRLEIERIDQQLAALAAERAALEPKLSAGGAGVAAAGRRLKQIAAEAEALEERWLALQAEIEALAGGQ